MRHILKDGMRARSNSRLLAVGTALIVAMPMTASAAPPSCKSITKGSLDVELPAGQRSSRMVRLSQGDAVNFSIHSGASGATVTLVSGSGAPRVIVPPGSNGMARFEAPETETFVFAIEAGRDHVTSVSANCTKPGNFAEVAAARTDVTVAQIETDSEGLSRRSAFSLGLSEFAASARAAESPVNRWADAAAAAGPAIDTAGSNEDLISAAALSIASNADVNAEDLETITARIERAGPAAVDGETQAAMTWAAILAPELSFDTTTPATKVAEMKRPAAKAARDAGTQQVMASAADAQPIDGWWVTHLEDDRGAENVVTETAVLRRDTVAGASFPPPMALGAFVPVEGIAAPQQ